MITLILDPTSLIQVGRGKSYMSDSQDMINGAVPRLM